MKRGLILPFRRSSIVLPKLFTKIHTNTRENKTFQGTPLENPFERVCSPGHEYCIPSTPASFRFICCNKLKVLMHPSAHHTDRSEQKDVELRG